MAGLKNFCSPGTPLNHHQCNHWKMYFAFRSARMIILIIIILIITKRKCKGILVALIAVVEKTEECAYSFTHKAEINQGMYIHKFIFSYKFKWRSHLKQTGKCENFSDILSDIVWCCHIMILVLLCSHRTSVRWMCFFVVCHRPKWENIRRRKKREKKSVKDKGHLHPISRSPLIRKASRKKNERSSFGLVP